MKSFVLFFFFISLFVVVVNSSQSKQGDYDGDDYNGDESANDGGLRGQCQGRIDGSSDEEESHYECYDLPTLGLSGYCRYSRAVCLERTGELVVIDDSEQPGTPLAFSDLQGMPYYVARYVGMQTHRWGEQKGIPFRSYLYGRFENSQYLRQSEIEWDEGTAVIAGFDSDSGNIYHFASKVMGAWYLQQRIKEERLREQKQQLRRRKRMGGEGEVERGVVLPLHCSVFETAIVNRTQSKLSKWQTGLLHAVMGSDECTNYIFANDMSRTLANAVEKTTCFNTAYSLGMDNAMFSGPEDAHMFQIHIWQSLGITPLYPFQSQGNIVFLKRSSPPFRSLLNEEAVLNTIRTVLDQRGEETRQLIVTDLKGMGFEEQVALFSSCAVLIAPHGAGLTNAIFMPQGGAVVEMNAHQFSFDLYRLVTMASGHMYFRIVARNNDTFPNPHDPYPPDLFSSVSFRGCMDSQCQEVARDLTFRIDEGEMQRLLEYVLSMVFK